MGADISFGKRIAKPSFACGGLDHLHSGKNTDYPAPPKPKILKYSELIHQYTIVLARKDSILCSIESRTYTLIIFFNTLAYTRLRQWPGENYELGNNRNNSG